VVETSRLARSFRKSRPRDAPGQGASECSEKIIPEKRNIARFITNRRAEQGLRPEKESGEEKRQKVERKIMQKNN